MSHISLFVIDGGLCRLNADEEMDGKAIAAGLASCPRPDWLKDVVVKAGLRLKVHTALRTLYNNSQVCVHKRFFHLVHLFVVIYSWSYL